MGLLAGDIVSSAAGLVADRFIDKLMPAKAPEFLEALQKVQTEDNQKLSLQDLDLDRDDELALIEMRDHAMNRGIESMEIEIDGNRYLMEVSNFSFVPRV